MSFYVISKNIMYSVSSCLRISFLYFMYDYIYMSCFNNYSNI